MAFHDGSYASQGLRVSRRLRVSRSTRLTTSTRLIAATRVTMAMNFTMATSFTTVTKSSMGKTVTMITVKIRTATAASGIAGYTSFPEIGLPTSRSSQRSHRLVHFLRIYVKYVHFRSWRTYITSSRLARKNLQINKSVSQERTYTSRLHGFQMLDLCSQTPPGIFISQRDQRYQRDSQVLDQEPFQTIDLFSWVTSCPLIRWRDLMANLTHRHLVDAPTCHN